VSSVNELDQATLEEVQERLQRVDTLRARAELEVRALLRLRNAAVSRWGAGSNR
jgi:hypothetical protein